MTDNPVNLNKVRKDRARADAKARADTNAVKHGRTKAQAVADAARSEKAREFLDSHRFAEDE